MALAAAKDLSQLNLADALELTVLVARKDPRKHPRVAAPIRCPFVAQTPDFGRLEESSVGCGEPAQVQGK